MPMTNEYRCFFYKNKLVDYGYYWSCLDDLSKINIEDFEKTGLPFAKKIAKMIQKHTTFFVLDIAKDVDGKWWVVEINDGQMSGLSTIPPERFYSNLNMVLQET